MNNRRGIPSKGEFLRKGIMLTAPAFGIVIFFSLFINVLMFVGPLYMLQVYDRVLTSRNTQTLLVLTILAGALLVIYALLEMFRSRVLVRAGILFDEHVAKPVFAAAHQATLKNPSGAHAQALRDVDVIREFFTGTGLIALCDAPWMFVFIGACFVMHPWFGYLAIGGAVIMFLLTLANDLATRKTLQEASQASILANASASSTFRNSEVLAAMGMMKPAREIWHERHLKVLNLQAAASDRAGVIVAMTKFARLFLQSLVLGVGAYLAIQREVSPGVMIAASIIFGRALGPVELIVANWKGFIGIRGSYDRIAKLMEFVGDDEKRVKLPAPRGHFAMEGVLAGPVGGKPILKGISFALSPGESLGVVGPSGAGKSTLARAAVGVWPAMSGKVRLDGSELDHWDPDQLGQFIGYLPQDVELFEGTIAENIARLGEVDDDKVLKAAMLAGVHEIIQQMPHGYNTQIGERGSTLSGGQRQRVGLARALYNDPAFVVLDEPNANLDAAGEEALLNALIQLRLNGVTTMIMTHRINILTAVDKICVMADGQFQAIGPKDEMLARLSQPRITRPTAVPASSAS
ncbi:ArpD ABC-type protease/lipase transport system, ATPase and permease components [Rhabdaerophilaceae bacterium]